jgi:hypothetical protein
MEEKFLGFYNFVAVGKTRFVARPASITVEVPASGAASAWVETWAWSSLSPSV